MHPSTVLARRPGGALLALAVLAALLAGVLRASPASAATRAMPGSFTGYAFDACQAPTQHEMDVWLARSPYWGVGIYTAGGNRYCKHQENLDADWVTAQTRNGWRLLPITVGRQASCSGKQRWTKVSADPSGSYATAHEQGRDEARASVAANRAYGIGAHSVLWLDVEAFDVSRERCRESMLAFVSAWTTKLHDLGYRSGLYSSASSGIRMLDEARAAKSGHALPDLVWLADWNLEANTRSSYVSDAGWAPHKRVKQYRGGHSETWGGVTLDIDSNFMDVGRGSVAPKPTAHCGVNRDFGDYPALRQGAHGPRVAALQCWLRQQGYGRIAVDGRYGAHTAAAVRTFERRHGLRTDGIVSRSNWMTLVSGGTTPLLKYGSASSAVRRVQRALNAASGAHLDVTGVFEGSTRAAVKRYQAAVRKPRSGVVTSDLWVFLRRGVRSR